MAHAFAPGLRIESHTSVEKIRELPVPGSVEVAVGDKVTGETIVARADLPGDLRILRIPERMGITPEEVLTGLSVKQGDSVKADQVICEHKGLFGLFTSRFSSPVTGTVELITERTGHVAIRLPSRPITLDAYVAGTVTKVTEGKGVTIRADGAFIQGIFGVGGEQRGFLQALSVDVNQRVTAESIPEDATGKILYGGMHPTLEALNLAAERGAVGFITGSIDDRALAGYLGFDLGVALTGDEPVTMSVIVTEGFGDIPFSLRAAELLKAHEGDAASINGATQVRAGALRPEIIVSHDGTDSGASAGTEEEQGLFVGRRVRLIRVPYFGKFAEVTELPHDAEEIETGAFTRVLRAKLEDSGDTVTVPRANVEII